MKQVAEPVPEVALHSKLAGAYTRRNRRGNLGLWLTVFATALPIPACCQITSVLTPQSHPETQSSRIQAVTHVTVIDPGTGAQEQRDMTILIRGSKIMAVENPQGRTFLPERRSMMSKADT